MKKFTQPMKVLSLIVTCFVCFSFSLNAANILSETFGTSLGNFTAQSLVGDQVWAWSSYSSVGFAKISGFASGNHDNDDWLISPSMDFSDVTKANLSFEHAHRYGVNLDINLTLMVSDSYTGGTIDTTKWTSIAFTHSDGASYTFISSGVLALDAYAGKENVRFAFRFKSSSTVSAATWEVNNVLVESVVDNTPTTVLEENFSLFTKGTLVSPSSTEWKDSLDTYTGIAGWTGMKVYSAGEVVKMGTSSVLGYLTTPSIDLSAFSGNFSISFDSRAWSGDATSIKILVNDVLAQQVDGLSNAAAPYSLSSYGPFELTGGTATTKITVSGLQASKGRFFLDNLKITQGGVASASATLTSEAFSIENGTTQSKNLTLKGANLTGNLTVALTNKAGSAFSTTITTVTAAQAMDSLGYALQVNYTPTAAGSDTATITITGGGLTDAVTATVTGKAWTTVSVADLAALRAASDANPTDVTTVYKITGEVLVNYTNVSGNSKYLQDATGGATIYDTKGLITSAFAIGDGMKDLKGTLALYGKLLEIIPVANVEVSSTGNTIIPVIMTIAEAKTNLSRYESTLIQINDLTSGKTGNFSTSKANYNFGNGTDTIVIRTNYTDLNYMGTPLPVAATNIRGLLIQYTTTVQSAQLIPRSLTDFGVPSSLSGISKSANVYGSNGILNVEATQGQVIEVYNLMGRKMLSTIANEGTNTFSFGRNQMLLVKVGDATSKIVL